MSATLLPTPDAMRRRAATILGTTAAHWGIGARPLRSPATPCQPAAHAGRPRLVRNPQA